VRACGRAGVRACACINTKHKKLRSYDVDLSSEYLGNAINHSVHFAQCKPYIFRVR